MDTLSSGKKNICSNLSSSNESLGVLDTGTRKALEKDNIMDLHPKLAKEHFKSKQLLSSIGNNTSRNSKLSKTEIAINTPQSTTLRSHGEDSSNYDAYINREILKIEDLFAENTIRFESSSLCTNQISFEPTEITGRSTSKLDKFELAQNHSLEDILATSDAEDVRAIRNSLHDYIKPRKFHAVDSQKSSTINSSGISLDGCPCADESRFAGESFVPAEIMNSKLAADERDWEQEFANLPIDSVNINSIQSIVEGTREADANFSLGNYFQSRSENLSNIVQTKEPVKMYKPVPLVDDSVTSSFPRITSAERDVSRRIDDKTFRMSTLSHIFNNIERITDDDDSVVVPLSVIRELTEKGCQSSDMLDVLLKHAKTQSFQIEPSKELTVNQKTYNKENVNPKLHSTELVDTLSFTGSILNDVEDLHSTHRVSKYFSEKSDRSNVHEERSKDKRNPVTVTDKKELEIMSQAGTRKRSHSNNSTITSTLKEEQSEPLRASRKRAHSSTNLLHPLENLTIKDRSRSPSPLEKPSVSTPTKSNNLLSPYRICSHTSETESPKSSSSSLDSTLITEQRFLADPAFPEYGKFSLPTYGAISRNPSLGLLRTQSRCNSQCSTSSEFSHRSGNLPIKCSVTELSWSSIKLRKKEEKTLQIKNIAHKRLVMRVEISGPGFQIINTDNSNTLTFQSQECRTLRVIFCPTVIGPAAGKLSLRPPFENSSTEVIIPLFGYGGHTSIIMQGILKGPVGSSFLTLGEFIHLNKPLVQQFAVYNRGPLSAFAIMTINSRGLDLPRLSECIEITPTKALLLPESTQQFQVKFRPRKNDIKKMFKKISSVMTVANLRIITGDEPTRQRIRKLIQKMNESQKSELTNSYVEPLWAPLPNEKETHNLDDLKEASEVAFDLISTFRVHEICLTVNNIVGNDTESTIIFPDLDETVVFKTPVSNTSESSNRHSELESWSVSPPSIELDPLDNNKNYFITIHNQCSTPQYFEVTSNFKHLFKFSPQEGQILPNKDVEVEVLYYQPSFLPLEQIEILVYLTNDKVVVPVYVKKYRFPAHFK